MEREEREVWYRCGNFIIIFFDRSWEEGRREGGLGVGFSLRHVEAVDIVTWSEISERKSCRIGVPIRQ